MDDVDLIVAITKGGESDPVTIRRPAWAKVIPAVGQLLDILCIDVDDIDIVVSFRTAIKGDLCPVWRPRAAAAHVTHVCQLFDIVTARIHDE